MKMDTNKFGLEGKIESNDLGQVFLTDIVKSEPSEFGIFTKCESYWNSCSSETDFVYHDHNYAICRGEKVAVKNPNPPDSDYSKLSSNCKIDCIDFSQAFQIDAVKNEPSDIDILTKCESHWNSSSREAGSVYYDHNYATHRCQEQTDELDTKNVYRRDLGHSKLFESLSTNTCSTVQIKKDDIDIFFEDIKGEIGDSELESHEERDETIAGEVAEDSYAASQRLSGSSDNEMKCKLYSHPLSVAYKENECKSRSKSFVKEGSLDIDERNYSAFNCKFCSKSFAKEHSLQRHERIHSRDKPYHCEYCFNFSYSQTGNLKVYRRSHTGEKLFYCLTCSKSFSELRFLKVHEKMGHTGQKPFYCQFCFKINQ